MSSEVLTSITTDNAQLECGIVPGGRKGAVVCHPWGKLGGSMNDPVVVSVRNELARAGFTVCRYVTPPVKPSFGTKPNSCCE
eukprot:2072512-Rhodomonas_salina.1